LSPAEKRQEYFNRLEQLADIMDGFSTLMFKDEHGICLNNHESEIREATNNLFEALDNRISALRKAWKVERTDTPDETDIPGPEV
jgi:hypothetical protein